MYVMMVLYAKFAVYKFVEYLAHSATWLNQIFQIRALKDSTFKNLAMAYILVYYDILNFKMPCFFNQS